MTMWVTNGSLSRLQVSYDGYSVNLAFSHPTVGVSAPQGAYMITKATLESLLDEALGCTAGSASTNSGGNCTNISRISGLSGVSGISSGISSLGTGTSFSGSTTVG